MLSIMYGGKEKIASAGVSVTTLLSAGTMPLIYFLLLRGI
jgi:hypothetical protein